MWKLAAALLLTSKIVLAFGGENLIVNGLLESEQADFPSFWDPRNDDPMLRYHASGGPGDKPYLALRSGSGRKISVRQSGLTLCAGEPYRLSGFFRTSNLRKNSGLHITTDGWSDSVRLEKLPPDTSGKWQFIEEDIIMPRSSGGYVAALYLAPGDGSFDAAELKLIPLSSKAKAESRSALESAAPTLIPLGYTAKIPASRPELMFQWTGRMKNDGMKLECRYHFGSPKQSAAISIPENGQITLNFSGLTTGKHTVNAEIIHNRQVIFQSKYEITIVETPRIDFQAKKRNNLVSEICNRKVQAGETVTIPKKEDGWLYLRFLPEHPGKGRITFGQKAVITPATLRGEAVRHVRSGEYKLTIQETGGELIVRNIPEILVYPCWENSAVHGNGSYDWAFMKKYALGAVTTISGGKMSAAESAEAKSAGLMRLGNFAIRKPRNAEELIARLAVSPGMKSNVFQGITVDELFYAETGVLGVYSQALQQYSAPSDKVLYTYIVGMPTFADTAFISLAANVANGTGRLLWENYNSTRATETDAAEFLKRKAGVINAYRRLAPGLFGSISVILGNFNQVPLLSLCHDPGVDYKYYLDMQCRELAAAPDYAGIKGVGWWGTHYADEEIARWSLQLMRHYAVDGNTALLSEKYGFRYRPEIIRNGDFAEGLTHWQVTGSVRSENHPGYGALQRRFPANGLEGDGIAVIPQGAALSQKMKLTPGKLYAAGFAAVDYNDLKKNRTVPRKLPVEISIDNAEVIPAKSYTFVDDRAKVHRTQTKGARINLKRVVFRAKSSETTLRIFVPDSPEKSETAVNYVSVNPYFDTP